MLQVNAQTYEKEVMKSEKPVIVDFTAKWCGTCTAIDKIITELINDGHKNETKFVKLDVGKNGEFARKQNVTSLPTILFISKGKEIARVMGRTSKAEFVKLIIKMTKKQK